MKKLAVTNLDIILNSGLSLEALEEPKIHEVCRQCIMPTKKHPENNWEILGFSFSKPYDDIFICASLPKGWKKVYSGTGRSIDIIDAQKRIRGRIVFHPRDGEYMAKAELFPRYTIKVIDNTKVVLEDFDGTALYTEKVNDSSALGDAKEYVEMWTEENYDLDWQNPLKHWD